MQDSRTRSGPFGKLGPPRPSWSPLRAAGALRICRWPAIARRRGTSRWWSGWLRRPQCPPTAHDLACRPPGADGVRQSGSERAAGRRIGVESRGNSRLRTVAAVSVPTGVWRPPRRTVVTLPSLAEAPTRVPLARWWRPIWYDSAGERTATGPRRHDPARTREVALDAMTIATRLNRRPRHRLGVCTPEDAMSDDAHCCTSPLMPDALVRLHAHVRPLGERQGTRHQPTQRTRGRRSPTLQLGTRASSGPPWRPHPATPRRPEADSHGPGSQGAQHTTCDRRG